MTVRVNYQTTAVIDVDPEKGFTELCPDELHPQINERYPRPNEWLIDSASKCPFLPMAPRCGVTR